MTTLLEALGLDLTRGSNRFTNGDNDLAALRHMGRTNMVFADGNARSIGCQKLAERCGDNVAPWMIARSDCPASG